jgi:hypothetical protein
MAEALGAVQTRGRGTTWRVVTGRPKVTFWPDGNRSFEKYMDLWGHRPTWTTMNNNSQMSVSRKQLEVRPHMCEDWRCENVNSNWWFVLCWLYKSYWCCCWCPETE